jgi:hypothetical protein
MKTYQIILIIVVVICIITFFIRKNQLRNKRLKLTVDNLITAKKDGKFFKVEIWIIHYNPFDKMNDTLICKEFNDNSGKRHYIKRRNAIL